MQIIKYVILLLIFILSNIIGKLVASKYSYRLEELKEIKNALNIFKTKVKFTYEPIPEIFGEISKNSSGNIGSIFKIAENEMKENTAEEAWKIALKESQNNLNEEDKKTLNMLSKLLGKSDVEGQISQIDITQSFLDKQIQDAQLEKNKNEKLYKKLGTVIGLALMIILV